MDQGIKLIHTDIKFNCILNVVKFLNMPIILAGLKGIKMVKKKLSVYTHCVKALCYDTHFLRNEKTHSGQKSSKSKQCGTAFAHHSHIQVLKSKHTEKKPYEYSHGDKDFVLYETY